MLTIGDMAPSLVRPNFDEASAASRLRRFHNDGIIQPIGRAGQKATSPYLYAPYILPLSVVLFTLYDMGIQDKDVLRPIAKVLSDSDGEAPHIVRILEETARGGKSYLVVTGFIRPSDNDLIRGAHLLYGEHLHVPITGPDDHDPWLSLTLNLKPLLEPFVVPRETEH